MLSAQFDTDTVVIGSGPSALILSYILSGRAPTLLPSAPHPDPALQSKLAHISSLFSISVSDLTSHFYASRFSYSTQALPANVLFDTLIRPLADTQPGRPRSCIEWEETGTRVEHLLLGSTINAGGQWQENPVKASWGIGALSYADLLELPGYGFEEHLRRKGKGEDEMDVEFLRPTRTDMAAYLESYPKAVGIEKCMKGGNEVSGVRRLGEREGGGFWIESHGIRCKRIVLASGTFSSLIPPRPQLQPLLDLPFMDSIGGPPLLIVGSGFSAADLIITHVKKRKIIHIFKWNPVDCVSPLRACNPQPYPEYAGVYRRMKLAAASALGDEAVRSPMARRKSNPFFDKTEMELNYEGCPNTYIRSVEVDGDVGVVELEMANGKVLRREVSGLRYVIGRRGSLGYLDRELREEILGADSANIQTGAGISGRTLRAKMEESFEVAPDVFAIGSLTGDSLIRHAYGGCIMTAGTILHRNALGPEIELVDTTKEADAMTQAITTRGWETRNEYIATNGHEHLGSWKETRRRPSTSEGDAQPEKRRKISRLGTCILV